MTKHKSPEDKLRISKETRAKFQPHNYTSPETHSAPKAQSPEQTRKTNIAR